MGEEVIQGIELGRRSRRPDLERAVAQRIWIVLRELARLRGTRSVLLEVGLGIGPIFWMIVGVIIVIAGVIIPRGGTCFVRHAPRQARGRSPVLR